MGLTTICNGGEDPPRERTMVKRMKSPRRLVALAVFAIVAMSAFGFAAQNTISNGGKAGDGYGQISGYVVTNVHYSTTGADITGVTFHLDSSATTASVGFADDGNGTNATALSACSPTNASKTNWSCPVAAGTVTALNAKYVRVVAAG